MSTENSGANKSRQVERTPVADQQDDESLPRPYSLAKPPSIAERVQAQREQIFKAISIVECCKHASATKLEVDDLEYMVPAFETVYDLLNSAAGELEDVASACKRLAHAVASQSLGVPFDPRQFED